VRAALRYASGVAELHFELRRTRCPRCSGEIVLRVTADESAADVRLLVDSACVACGVGPWPVSDERLLVFRPGRNTGGASGGTAEELAARLAVAQARIEQQQRRIEGLERDLEASRRDITRAETAVRGRQSDVVTQLRADISRLEGELAAARAEVRKNEEATRGEVQAGKRAIDLD
jgi:hypothetical protein